MTPEMTAPNRSRDLIETYLDGMSRRKELLPGTKDRLLEQLTRKPYGTSERALGAAAEFFESEEGRRYLDPGHKVEPEHPLQTHLRRLAPMLADNAPDAMFEAWAGDFVFIDNPRVVAEEVARRLGRSEAAGFLREKPARSWRSERVLEVLRHFRPLLKRDLDLEELAEQRDWMTIGDRPAHEVAKVVAQRLQQPIWAADLCRNGTPPEIDWEDAVFHPEDPAAVAEARRETAGRLF